jgi:hypothetical protein
MNDSWPARVRTDTRKLEHNGALAYRRVRGFPPQCRAVGEQDFTCD